MVSPDQTNSVPAPSKRKKKKWRTAALGTNPHGQPQHRGAGRPPRQPEPPDPKIDQRQTMAFELHVAGRSKRAIAEALGVSLETVALDIRMEAERRAIDRARDRETLIQGSVARYEAAIASAREAIDACRRSGFVTVIEEDASGTKRSVRKILDPKSVALMALHQDSMVKAQKALDRVLGLSSPLPAGSGAAPPVTAENAVIVLLDGMQPDQRLAQWSRLLDEAKSLGVAPAQPALPK